MEEAFSFSSRQPAPAFFKSIMAELPPPPAPAEVLDEPAGAVPAGVEAAAEVVPPPVVEAEVFFLFVFVF